MVQNKANTRIFKRKSNITGNIRLFRYAQAKKKQKWTFLLQALKRGKVNFSLSTTTQQSVPFKSERLPKSFALNWAEKQALKVHYGVLRENTLKTLSKKALKASCDPNIKDLDLSLPYNKVEFLRLFESRLDICLWKAHFFSTLGEARQAIRAGKVFIEAQRAKNYGRLLKEKELISLNYSLKEENLKRERLLQTAFFQDFGQLTQFSEKKPFVKSGRSPIEGWLGKGLYYPPRHLEINYPALRFVFIGKPDILALQWPYNIYLNKIELEI